MGALEGSEQRRELTDMLSWIPWADGSECMCWGQGVGAERAVGHHPGGGMAAEEMASV